jgi:hypothetical protein
MIVNVIFVIVNVIFVVVIIVNVIFSNLVTNILIK